MGEWNWFSFALGGLALPALVFVGGMAWSAVEEWLRQRAQRRAWAETCDRCACTRGMHGGNELRCPRPLRYEEDPSATFMPIAERSRAHG